jgi:hypothetical protein
MSLVFLGCFRYSTQEWHATCDTLQKSSDVLQGLYYNYPITGIHNHYVYL